MRKLWKYLKPYRKECFLGPLFKLVEALFELAVPLVVANMIDIGIGNGTGGDRGFLLAMSGVLLLLAVLGLACALAAQYFAARAAVGFCADVRRDLFAHIQTFSYSRLEALGTDTLITRLTGDLNQIQSGVNLTLRLLLRSPFVVLGAVVMAFTVDPPAATVFAVTVPLLTLVIFAVMLAGIPLYKTVQKKSDALLAKIRENLSGMRVVRAFCREAEEERIFGQKNRELAATQIKAGNRSAILNPVTMVLIDFGIVAVIAAGGVRVFAGALTRGGVVALYHYMLQILVELIKFASLVITVTKAVASAKRVAAILATPSGMEQGNQETGDETTKNAAEFRGVSLTYGGEEALHDIDLALPRGALVGIIGSTGSGKSSLIHLLPRLYDATAGTVLVDGVDVRSYSFAALRKKVAVVPQKTVLFAGTVRENLKMGNADATDDELWKALRIAQAEQTVKEKNGGLDYPVEQEGRNFSGGQRARLAVARALAEKPEILILDDSLSALDYATAADLLTALKTASTVQTVLLVSQRVAAIRRADVLVVLEEGALAGVGTYESLKTSCEVFREICASQEEL